MTTRRQQPTNGQSTRGRLEAEAAKRNRQLAVLDFFCGAGGLTCGSLLAGAKVVCGIDCDGRARKTFQGNNRNGDGSVPFLHARIEDVTPAALAELLEPY
ncbi:MAG: hypothetical protein V3T72_14300, partial [Thermoanaerobaculia bacterium]